jgi:LmbE family N-acetylglucosaminyl deacetylase
VVDRLGEFVAAWQPQTLYVPHVGEMHPDHRAAARIVRRTLVDLGGDGERPSVRGYEIWTPMQRMDLIVDISPYVETKRAAIRAYKSQCEVLRFDEAVLGLNRYRGEMHSWPGGDYAEIFIEQWS